jgi:hypothetical protein
VQQPTTEIQQEFDLEASANNLNIDLIDVKQTQPLQYNSAEAVHLDEYAGGIKIYCKLDEQQDYTRPSHTTTTGTQMMVDKSI